MAIRFSLAIPSIGKRYNMGQLLNTVSLFFVGFILVMCAAVGLPQEPPVYDNSKGLIQNCADPFVLKHEGVYYLYCSGGLGEKGIRVYRSTDLADWGAPVGHYNGQALRSEDVWGDRNFWAPEVYFLNGKFFMYFAVQERLAVAESDSPTGPFIQKEKKPFEPDHLKIDPHLFVDDDGTKYFYFVRFNNGNEIWVAKLNDDLRSIDESTMTLCIATSQDWENSRLEPFPGHRINEAPFVLKRKGIYYLTYSANHTVNPGYGVGYATSDHPMGPWKKVKENPILSRDGRTINGPGHHSFIQSPSGHLYIVYHTHFNMEKMQPRKLAIDPCEFISNPDGGPDILKVDGPSTGKRRIL
jgi:beta-xylosidase